MTGIKRIDRVVLRETLYIALWTAGLSLIMEAVFLIIRHWDYTVILGNILGAAVAVLNFFLMGLGVQSAVNKDEKDAKNTVRMSQTLRLFMLMAVAAVIAFVPAFNLYSGLIPLFFPRIGIAFRPLIDKLRAKGGGDE